MAESGPKVVLAGSTGQLGLRIARALKARGADVLAPVRRRSAAERLAPLREAGIEVVEADLGDRRDLEHACRGAVCVVSALSGLGETIVEAQSTLLDAAVAAGVPRFIPSDFSIDFRELPPGSNRNFDLRRDFHVRLDAAPIAATSVFNGAFMDMLTGQAPLIVDRFRRVLYVENADQPLDFTTMDDTAAFTAAVALDPSPTPRALHVAGDRVTARQLAEAVGEVRGTPYRVFRAGSLGFLAGAIKVVRALKPSPGEVFPPWQGMQYLHSMFSGRAGTPPLDNDRYPGLAWTDVRTFLRRHPPAG